MELDGEDAGMLLLSLLLIDLRVDELTNREARIV